MDHQGIAYRSISDSHSGKTYPLVLLSKFTEGGYEVARRACREERGILVADKEVGIDEIGSRLRGNSATKDDFELSVNREEEKLVSIIRKSYFEASLPFVRKWFWPRMSKACCVLSHDVDWFKYSPFHKQTLKQSLNPARISRMSIDHIAKGRDYGWNIPEIIELERSYRCRSTFFFQADYGPHDDFLRRSVELLKTASFEIGLHGAESSHIDREHLNRELRLLESKTGERPLGVRYHILKFNVPQTWEIQSSEGLSYDATFYFNRFFGFRAGTCFPFHPITENSRLSVIELPTGYMDWTSLHRSQGSKQQVKVLARLVALVNGFHGVLVVNFHNTYLNKTTFPTIYRSYKWLLEKVKEEGFWVATARDCVRWWRMRADARIEPRFESGKVTCSPSVADVVVEEEGKERTIVPAASQFQSDV